MERISTGHEKFSSIAITVEFLCVCTVGPVDRDPGLLASSGGLDILFSKQKKHEISIPAHDTSGSPINVAFLIKYLCGSIMRDKRKELFVQDETM